MKYRCTRCALDFDADEARCPQCLRMTSVRAVTEATPEAPLDESDVAAAERHVKANAVLQAVLWPLSIATTLSVGINLFLSQHAELVGPLRSVYAHDAPGEETAQMATFVCVGVWALLGIVWTPLNAWGLWKRKRWARISTLLYWIGSFTTCVCLPLGAYGIYALLRRDVRSVLTK